MRDTSQIANYDAIIAEGEYRVETKLVINGVTYYEEDLKSIATSSALFSDVPSVGNCYSAEIDVVMVVPSAAIPRMAEIKPYVRLLGETLVSDWIPQGVFYIDTREQSGENSYLPLMAIHGYDAMLMTESVYPEDDPENYPMVDTDVVDFIAEAIGVEVDDRTYDIMTEEYEINLPATYTMREVLSYIGSMYAGNWCMSAEGKLRLVGLTDIGVETNYLIDEQANAIVFGEDGTHTETKTGAMLKIWAEEESVDAMAVQITPFQAGAGDPSPTNIRPIQGWEETNIVVSPTSNDNDGTTYTVSLNISDTFYYGELNVTTGVFTVNKVGINMGSLTWSYASSVQLFRVTRANMPYVPKRSSLGQTVEQTLCSCYKSCTSSTATDIPNKAYILGASGLSLSYDIFVRDSSYTRAADFKTSVTNQIVVYELNTPIEQSLTQTEIETYFGINYIHATTGNVTVTWTVDTEATHILV